MKSHLHPARRLPAATGAVIPMFIFCLLSFVFFIVSPAFATDVSVELSPAILTLGEAATYTLVFSGSPLPNSAPGLPDVDGLQIQPAGTMSQSVNGYRSMRFSYRIFPRRAGEFPIGPFDMDFNGSPLRIPERSLSVREPDPNAPATDPVFLRASLDPESPIVGQPFSLTLAVCSLPDVELARDVSILGGLPESGFVLGSWEEFPTVREDINGRICNVHRFRVSARALTAGSFSLAPVLRVAVVDRSARRSRDPFSGFFDDPFFSSASATPVSIAAPPSDLLVRPLPAEGRPAGFSGAVGSFSWSVSARPLEVKTGEPVTVTLRVSGSGNIADVIPPSFSDSPLFKAYEPRLSGNAPDPAARAGEKVFEQVLIPRSVDLAEIPALSFSFFDPKAGGYRSVSSDPIPLSVSPGDTPASALLLQTSSSDAASPRTLILGSDIVYLKPMPRRWSAPALPPPLALTLSAALPLAALAALAFAARRRRRLASDVAYARRLQAPRVARAAIRAASRAAAAPDPDPSAVFTPLADAVRSCFAHRLNLPPGSVDPEPLLARLSSAGASPEDLAAWREFFAIADQIRFAPSSVPPSDLPAWPPRVAALLHSSERLPL